MPAPTKIERNDFGGPFIGEIVLLKVDEDKARPLLITSVLDHEAIEGILFYGGQVDGLSCKWLRRNIRGMPPNDAYPYTIFHKVVKGEELGQWRFLTGPSAPAPSATVVDSSPPSEATKTTSAKPATGAASSQRKPPGSRKQARKPRRRK